MQNWRGDTYESHLTKEGYILLLIKQKLRFELKVPDKLIREFEDAVRDDQRESDSWTFTQTL